MRDTSIETAESKPLIHWGAIAAGCVIALGTMGMLYAAGLGGGLSAVDLDVDGRMRGVGMFAGIFGAAVPLVALLLGGFAAARSARASTVAAGAFHGWVLWGVVAVGLIWLTGHIVGSVVSGAASTVGEVAKASGSVVAHGAQALGAAGGSLGNLVGDAEEKLSDTVDLQFDDVLKPINARRATKGDKPISSAQVQDAAKALATQAIKTGDLDKEQAVTIIVNKTSVSRAEAEELSNEVDKQVAQARKMFEDKKAQAKTKMEEVKGQAEATMKQATEAASEQIAKVCWGLFAALAAGLVASVGGGVTAVYTSRQ